MTMTRFAANYKQVIIHLVRSSSWANFQGINSLVFRLKIFGCLGGIDRLLSRLPVGGTNLAMLLSKLEGLKYAQRLVGRTTYWQVVHHRMTQNSLRVDQEQTAECDSARSIY